MGDWGYAFNQTRQRFLAANLGLAQSHWSRLRGLMFIEAANFSGDCGLWIHPSHGIHTFAMRFPIDVVYLDRQRRVVHLEFALRPWRVAPVLMKAASVLELPIHTLRDTGTALGDEIEIGVGERKPAVPA